MLMRRKTCELTDSFCFVGTIRFLLLLLLLIPFKLRMQKVQVSNVNRILHVLLNDWMLFALMFTVDIILFFFDLWSQFECTQMT